MWEPDPSIVHWFGYLKEFVIFIGLLAAAFLTYTKFVIERGIFPPVQFWIECETVGLQDDSFVLEIVLHLKNLGSSVLVATNICLDVRYLVEGGKPEFLKRDPEEEHLKGRLCFPHCLKEEVMGCILHDHKFHILDHSTFVKAGVDQVYTFITKVPKSTSYIRIFSSFKYPEKSSTLQKYCLRLGRSFGLINYTLKNICEPHTCERVFKVQKQRKKSLKAVRR